LKNLNLTENLNRCPGIIHGVYMGEEKKVTYTLTCKLTETGVECSEHEEMVGNMEISPACREVLKTPPACDLASIQRWAMCRAIQLMKEKPEEVKAQIPYTKSRTPFGAALSLARKEAIQTCKW
jgi:hypothetical protein